MPVGHSLTRLCTSNRIHASPRRRARVLLSQRRTSPVVVLNRGRQNVPPCLHRVAQVGFARQLRQRNACSASARPAMSRASARQSTLPTCESVLAGRGTCLAMHVRAARLVPCTLGLPSGRTEFSELGSACTRARARPWLVARTSVTRAGEAHSQSPAGCSR